MTQATRWLSVRVRPGADRVAVTAALFTLGSQGVQEVGDELHTAFEASLGEATIRDAIRDASPGAQVEVSAVAPVDWSEAWKARIGLQELGAIDIAPPWLAEGRDPARTVVIEPEMAFGTGEHATTRGVVRLMQGVVRRGDRIADLGAGSAVLAIAAAKLGARSVAAIELDPEAISNAEENVRRNGVEDRVRVLEGDATHLLPLVAPVRVIFANIISSVLLQILPLIGSALEPDGRAILSGILEEEREEMLQALEEGGWRVEGEDREDIWWSVVIAR